jgi:pyrrolysine biosynthesis protein PylC
MKVAVVGGKLQGVEAAYLSRQAGWHVSLIDRTPDVPARGLAHSYIQADVTADVSDMPDIFQDMDLVIPALENDEALESLKNMAERKEFPLAYDKEAYAITSSKIKSDMLFKELDLPLPRPWPECGFPVILKPSGSSGSRGIRKIDSREELASIRQKENRDNGNAIIQEYCEGPSYSLEVVGDGKNFRPLQPTIIEVDRNFDCERVIAPAGLSKTLANRFDEIAVAVAGALGLRGIMDIEVILHQNELKVLEIDARLPSQTPTVVLKSTGINMLELLYKIFGGGTFPDIPPIENEKEVIFEHIRVKAGRMEISGEHIISEARPLSYRTDFFGADEALTDFDPDRTGWVATLIMTGEIPEKVTRKRNRVLERIRETFGLKECVDFQPE